MDTVSLCLVPVERDSNHLAHVVLDGGSFRILQDGKGNILVADTSNHRIQKFTAQGEFLTAVGTKGSGPLQFDEPCGIAVNASSGRVYI